MDLSLLGLTDNEEKAYRTLIRLGKVSASEVSRESGVSYGKIYEVLARLEAKGLVQVIPETTKKFLATNPENLIKLIEKKEEEFKNMKKEAEKLKKEYQFHEEEPIKIARGKKNFPKIVRELSKKEKTFSYSVKWTADWNPEYVRRSKENRKLGVDSKVMTQVTDVNKENLKKWLSIHPNFHEIENQGVVFDINDHYVLIVLINQNVIMTIKDKAFISMMKIFFENTYNKTPNITANTL